MRRIGSRAEAERIKKRNQIIVGGALIVIMLLSIIGYSFSSEEQENNDNKVSEFGLDFYKQNGVWLTQIGDSIFSFQNLPSEVLEVDVNVSVDINTYSGQPLYFVNPEQGVSDILNNLGPYVLRYQEACLINSTCQGDLPEKSCDNNLIVYIPGNESRVYQEDSCVFILGDSVLATDAFLYKILQII
jgi:hypothetical protein